jgi:hypothetical protein
MKSCLRFLASIALATAASLAAAADIGRVVLAAGDTTALRQGQVVPLRYGSAVQDTDSLRTGDASNLQVRFEDDSYVSMRENSELRVQEFRFSGQADGTERAIFNLVKGGMRAITGLIGRANHENYRMTTPTSTIGIRGTDYASTVCLQDECRNRDSTPAKPGTYGRVIGQSHGTNQIEVSNDAGSRVLGINSNFYVGDRSGRIELLLEPPGFVLSGLPSRGRGGIKGPSAGTGKERVIAGGIQEESRPNTPPTPDLPLTFYFDPFIKVPAATENLDHNGRPAVFPSEGPPPPTTLPPPAATITGQVAWANGGALPVANTASLNTSQVTLSGANLIAFGDGATFPSGMLNSGTIVETGSVALVDGSTMNWGRWTGAGVQVISSPGNVAINPATGVPFVLGSANTILPTSGSFLYSFAGGPNPVNTSGNVGSFTGGAFNVTFGSTSGSMSVASPLTMSVGGVGYSLNSCSSGCTFANSPAIAGNMVLTGTCFGGACSTSSGATANAAGIFVGPQGAGLAVAGNVTSLAPTVTFGAGFKR